MTAHRILRSGWLAAIACVASPAAQSDDLFRAYPERVQPLPGTPSALALGDFDADGDLDAALGGGGVGLRVFRNDGLGALRIDLPASVLTAFNSELHAADLDGDGDLDLIGAGNGPLLRNDGTGHFTPVTDALPPFALSEANQTVLADFDGDGDLDIASTGSRVGQRMFFNDGTGRFLDLSTRLGAISTECRALAAGDVDGDGDVDLVFAGYGGSFPAGGPTILQLNDGTGRFRISTTGIQGFTVVASDCALLDLDGDSDLDLLIAQIDFLGNPSRPVRGLRNDGSGNFTEFPAGTFPADGFRSTSSLRPFDVDGDSDLDLLLLAGGSRPRLWTNDGQGRFSAVSQAVLPSVPSGASRILNAAVADLDGDRDLDVVLSTDDNMRGVVGWYGRQVQLDADRQPTLGNAFSFEVGRRPLGATNSAVAVTLLAAARARIDLGSLGILGIDPRDALPLDTVQLPANGGSVPFSLTVPNDPDLVGVRLFAQAVVVESGAGARDVLTNVWPLVLSR